MKPRQSSIPRQWLVADERLGDGLWSALRKLPRGSGVLILYRDLRKRERARLVARIRQFASSRGLTLVDETEGKTARVHDLRELRGTSIAVRLAFLSPMFATASHPEWAPMPQMRAATLARLARMPVIALGGMDAKRFGRIRRLGFHGWAGIDAWLRT